MRKHVTKGLIALATVLVLVSGSGCAVTQAAKPVTPPPPAPVAIQDPPTVIVAQTSELIPEPQPIPPESLPQEPAPGPLTPEPPAARQPRRNTPAPNHPKEPEPVQTEAPPENHSPPVRTGPALIPSDSNVAGRDIEARIADVRARVQKISSRSNSRESQLTQDRIASFLKLAEDSLARNDLRQANLQSSRALTLVQDLER